MITVNFGAAQATISDGAWKSQSAEMETMLALFSATWVAQQYEPSPDLALALAVVAHYGGQLAGQATDKPKPGVIY